MLRTYLLLVAALTYLLLVAALSSIAGFAAEPTPAPDILAWATFDARDLGFPEPNKGEKSLVVGSGEELHKSIVNGNASPSPEAVWSQEKKLVKLLSPHFDLDWKKHRVVLYFGGPSRFEGEFRLDLRRTGDSTVAARWTFMDKSEQRLWWRGSAVVITRTEDNIKFDKRRFGEARDSINTVD